ncbi:MAG: hypothetical protein KDA91_08665 [Planctomycetaceae bacterium]|nr:hypothetical protein [Planctomycetaceae bacterium]
MSRFYGYWALPCLLVSATGCMQPMGSGYMYGPSSYQYPQQYQYPQNQVPQMYGAPAYGSPGTLVVPQSDAPPYSPGSPTSTYEDDPKDTWSNPSGGTGSTSGGNMFGEDPVPKPKDPAGGGGSFYDDNFPSGPGAMVIPGSSETPADSGPEFVLASTVSRPVSYGFDVNGYRWLQGLLSQDENGTWSLKYNPAADDTFQGDLTLILQPQQLAQISPGSVIQVQGKIDSAQLDSRGRATYLVQQIHQIPGTVQ